MRTRPLGNTGLSISVLGYGASPLGGVFRPIEEEAGIRAVRSALDTGINLFDTSPYYGQTRSETVLGRALRGVPRACYVLCTKVGRYGTSDFDFSPTRIEASINESLGRLGVDYLDVVYCHDIEYVPLQPVIQEALPALQRVRDAGKVRFIGVSGYPLKIFRRVMEQAAIDVLLSYCHYTLFNRSLEGLLEMAAQKGVGVINASPLGMGLLTDAGPPGWHPAPPDVKEACARAAELCRSRGASISALAIQFAAANPAIACTLTGMPDEAEVRANAEAVHQPPDPELLRAVEHILAGMPGSQWPTGLLQNQGD